MITSIKIENFKAIESVTIEFNKMNVLIGANAAGKTTILQAMDFLFCCVGRDAEEYLKDRGWNVEDIKSQISQSRTVAFELNFDFIVDQERKMIRWYIEFITNISDGKIYVQYESIMDMLANLIPTSHNIHAGATTYSGFARQLLRFDQSSTMLYDEQKDTKVVNDISLRRSSSVLKDISYKKHASSFPTLLHLKEYLEQCTSFELLSPDRIRHSARGKTLTIGRSGEKLAAFIRNLDKESKSRYLKKICEILPYINSVDTIVRGRPGWVEMIVSENYQNTSIKTKSAHISDGTLRLIAMVALTELPTLEGTYLLDEIEDGINPYIASKLISLLYGAVYENKRQIIITTHSSVILDDIKPEDIFYVYRDAKGAIQITKAFQKQKIKEMLTYMQPGEIWLNVPESDLIAEDIEPLK